MSENAKYVKLQSAIEQLGESPVWVRRQVTHGKLAGARKDANGHWWIPQTTIDAKLAAKANATATTGTGNSNYVPIKIRAADTMQRLAENDTKLTDEKRAIIVSFCKRVRHDEEKAWERRKAGGSVESDEPIW